MEVEAEKVKPYEGDQRQKGQQVKEMFDNIAPSYDFMNRAMTAGVDKVWRHKAIKGVIKNLDERGIISPNILDVATGTADLAIKMAKDISGSTIMGVDLSEQMLSYGRKKVREAGLSERISLKAADCLDLPFDDDVFDAVTVAFGVRNFEHLLDGYKEIYRVLKSGGCLCVIELSTPTSPITKPLYDLYTTKIIPLVGRIITKDTSAYSYLPASIAAVPQREKMTALMTEAGFNRTSYRCLTMGVCTIYYAHK